MHRWENVVKQDSGANLAIVWKYKYEWECIKGGYRYGVMRVLHSGEW